MKRPSTKGFSIVETLLIIVVIGLVGFVGSSVYKSHTKNSLNSAINQKPANNTFTTSNASCLKQMSSLKNGDKFVTYPKGIHLPADYPDEPVTAGYHNPMTVNYLLSHRTALIEKRVLLKATIYVISGGGVGSGPNGPVTGSPSLLLGDNCDPYDATNLMIRYEVASIVDPNTHNSYVAEYGYQTQNYVSLQKSDGNNYYLK